MKAQRVKKIAEGRGQEQAQIGLRLTGGLPELPPPPDLLLQFCSELMTLLPLFLEGQFPTITDPHLGGSCHTVAERARPEPGDPGGRLSPSLFSY